MNHFAIHLKLTQYCKSTIIQLEKREKSRYDNGSKGQRERLEDANSAVLEDEGRGPSQGRQAPSRNGRGKEIEPPLELREGILC